MKHLALVFFILFSLFVSGQPARQKSKLSVGISFSPDYSYRYLRGPFPKTGFSAKEFRDDLETPKLGFTTGVTARYQFATRFALESGLKFSDKNYEYSFDSYFIPDGYGVAEDPLIPQKLVWRYHYYYLGVPVKLNYYFKTGKFALFVTGGISSDFFIGGRQKTILTYSDRVEEWTDTYEADFNNIAFTGLAGFGAETDLSEKIRFCFEPVFRYSFTPLVDAPLKEHLYSAGVNFTVFYNLASVR